MDLPPAADAMYKTWWALANDVGTSVDEQGNYLYTFATGQEAAAAVNRDVYGGQGGYNPIGFSQLMSVARKIGNATAVLAAAQPGDAIGPSMVAEAPWSNPPAVMAAAPQWQIKVQMTYTDPAGTVIEGAYGVTLQNGALPATVGDLHTLAAIQMQAQLADTSPTKTPRSGQLVSIDSITILAV